MKLSNIISVIILTAFCVTICGGQTEPNDLSQYYGFKEMEIIKLDWGIHSLRVADFDGDGKNDIAIVNDLRSRIDIFLQKTDVSLDDKEISVDQNDVDINAIVTPSRFRRQSVSVSQKIYSFQCADLNNDKLIDLVYYGEPRGLYVILQKPSTGEPNKPRTLLWQNRKKINIDDGLTTQSALACGDLNNDGRTDIVLAANDAVYIIYQKEDGTLAEPVKMPVGSGIQIKGVEIGDINGDGINDLILITTDPDRPLIVRFGQKNGKLGPQYQFAIENPWALELAKLYGSGADDILMIDALSGRLMCYKLVTDKDKDADWPIIYYPLVSGEGSSKRDLVIGDFDGDGLTDVVISDPGAAELIMYKQTPSSGLAEPVRFPAFSDIDSISAADIENNGRTELAVLSIKEKAIGISKYENGRLTFPKPLDIIGEPVAMELGDLDNDSTIDCAYISKDANDVRTFRILYNIANIRPPTPAKKDKKDKQPAQTAALPAVAVELKKLTSNPDGIAIVDVDGDGLKDILVFNKYNPPPILIRQTSKGVFEVVDSASSQASLIKEASLSTMTVGETDANKPGKKVLVAQNNFARSLVLADGKKWTTLDQYNAKSTENKISTLGVFNIFGQNTAQPEIVFLDGQKGQLQILKAGKDKIFHFEKEISVGKWNESRHLKMLFAPLASNKSSSVVLFDGEKFALITQPSESFQALKMEQQFVYETKIKDGVYGNLTTGDLNNDGKMDIAMVDYKNNNMEILALDPTHHPVPAMRFKIFEHKEYRGEGKGAAKSVVEPRELKIADVTGDGKNDLITVIHDRIIIYPQD